MDKARCDGIAEKLVNSVWDATNSAIAEMNAAQVPGTNSMQIIGTAFAQVFFDLIALNMAEGKTFADTVQTVTALASGSFTTVATARSREAGITPFAPEDLGPRVLN